MNSKMVQRALIFSDSLIKLAEVRGHQVVVDVDQRLTSSNGTKINVFGEPFHIRVREIRRRIINSNGYWPRSELISTGVMSLKLDELFDQEWKDTPHVKLENKLAHIIASIELRAKKEIRERKEREIRQQEYERKREIERQLREQKTNELDAFKTLLANANRWDQTQKIAVYIKAYEANISEGDENEEPRKWLVWARAKLDWYNPLSKKEDVLLNDVDRDTLDFDNNRY